MRILLLILTLAFSLPSTGFALDSASFVPASPKIQDTGVPVGTVIVWTLDSLPPPVEGVQYWLECNGQAIPADSNFNKLRTILGKNVLPNYNTAYGFLKGTTSGAGTRVEDSIKSHTLTLAPHQHTVSGTAEGQSFSAGGGQSFSYEKMKMGTGTQTINQIHLFQASSNTGSGTGERYGISSSGTGGGEGGSLELFDIKSSPVTVPTTPTYTSTSVEIPPVSGTTSGGTITGYTNEVGGTGYYTGASETTPKYTKVRYLIKAR